MRSRNRIEWELSLGFISTCPAIPRALLITEGQFCFCFPHGDKISWHTKSPRLEIPTDSVPFTGNIAYQAQEMPISGKYAARYSGVKVERDLYLSISRG